MVRFGRPLQLALASAVLLTGCRTVWIHPNASPAKFAADRAQCQRDVASVQPGDTGPQNWKACLLAQGWTTRTDFRSAAAVRESWPDRDYPGPRGRRD